jgi:hypothetical protein
MEDIEHAEICPEEITEAFATLLYGFLHVFNDAEVDMIVGSVTRRLRRLRLVPEVMLTRMHGAMRAASAGQSPLRWREQFGPMPPAEALAWAYATWLLADLLEYLAKSAVRDPGPGSQGCGEQPPSGHGDPQIQRRAADLTGHRRHRQRWQGGHQQQADHLQGPQPPPPPCVSSPTPSSAPGFRSTAPQRSCPCRR